MQDWGIYYTFGINFKTNPCEFIYLYFRRKAYSPRLKMSHLPHKKRINKKYTMLYMLEQSIKQNE